jgi:hypothetical protein
MNKRALCKVLLIVQLALGWIGTSAWAQPGGETVVHAIGSSRISGGDLSKAREEALQAGLIIAVHRALTDAIPIEALVGQFKLVNEAVLSRTGQFVRDYKVLTEADTGGTYRLVLQATVSVERLRAAVEPWLRPSSEPGVLEMRVSGVGGRIAEFVRFRGALNGITGIGQLQMKGLDSDTGVLTATYQGSARTLADQVQLLNFETFEIQIVQVQANTIEMRLVAR